MASLGVYEGFGVFGSEKEGHNRRLRAFEALVGGLALGVLARVHWGFALFVYSSRSLDFALGMVDVVRAGAVLISSWQRRHYIYERIRYVGCRNQSCGLGSGECSSMPLDSSRAVEA